MAKKYRVIALEVWGNAADGYEVNNWFPTNIVLTLSDDVPPSDRQVIAALKAEGLIRDNVRYASVGIYETGETLEIVDATTGEPIYNLKPVGETK